MQLRHGAQVPVHNTACGQGPANKDVYASKPCMRGRGCRDTGTCKGFCGVVHACTPRHERAARDAEAHAGSNFCCH